MPLKPDEAGFWVPRQPINLGLPSNGLPHGTRGGSGSAQGHNATRKVYTVWLAIDERDAGQDVGEFIADYGPFIECHTLEEAEESLWNFEQAIRQLMDEEPTK